MDVHGPKNLDTPNESRVIGWARTQLQIASDIIDNPGGGLLFASQACGQVRAALMEEDEDRWHEVAELLLQAEDAAVRRRFERARELIGQALQQLVRGTSAT